MEKLLKIKVIPNSKLNKIVEEADDYLKIKLMPPAIDGKANKALIGFLAKHFKISKNKIQLVAGEKSREKVVKLNTWQKIKPPLLFIIILLIKDFCFF